jgi:uncharacterized delta-60 repeat protein
MPATTKNLFFIDSHVADYETLIANLPMGSEWFLLNPEEDGIAQMVAVLSGYANLDSIQILSHGSPGTLYLGSTRLNNDNLANYSNPLAQIGGSLTETGDMLLYGCNVAQGEAGLAFINTLAQMTGADVAASEGLTGPVELGGDGVLEQVSGNVQATSLPVNDLTGLLAVNTAPTFVVSDGKVTTDFFGRFDWSTSINLQADGKILVVGGATNSSGGRDFALARYNTNGSLDASFNSDGKLTTNFSLFSEGNSITIQADGKILVAGSAIKSIDNYDFALARYNANGSLDTSFDGDGKVTTDFFGSHNEGNSITLQADGKILVAGSAYNSNGNNDFALARYNPDGSLDTSFDSDGKVTTDFSSFSDKAHSITVQADGKILVVGGSSGVFALARYNADGSLDTSFDSDGKVTTDFGSGDSGNSITIQADGKILVAGSAYMNSGKPDFALARYNPDGSLDTSFDSDGKVTTDFFGNDDYGYSITLQADGKILVAGSSRGNFALARYNTDGSLDASFDSDGKVTSDFSGIANGITLQADGKILVAGYSFTSSGGRDFALARYNPDGSLDTTFSPPENTLTNAQTVFEQSPNVLDSNVQIRDAELAASGNYNGATLTLASNGGGNAEDIFSAKTGGTLTALTPSAYFAVDSISIGRVTTNSNGTLVLTFNTNATQPLVDKAMQQIAYRNTSDAPPATVLIDWTFNDGNTGNQGEGGAMSVTGSTTVSITPVNDAPRLSNALADQSVATGAAFSFVLPANAFSDPDGDTLTYSIAMTDGTGAPPWLAFNSSTGTFSGSPYALDVGSFDIRVTAKDSSNASASDVFQLTVAADTTAPTVTITDNLPGVANLSTDSVAYTLAFSESVSGLAANDFTVTHGTVSLVSGSGSTWTVHVTPTLGVANSTIGLTLKAGAVSDAAGNLNLIAADANQSIDTVAPTVESFNPANGAVGVALNSNIVITFSEAIARGEGSILLKTAVGNLIESFDAAVSSRLTISGASLSIDPSLDLAYNPDYQIEFAAGAIKDLAGNSYAGSSSYTFTTNTPPSGAVSISGMAIHGQTLSASNSLVDADGLGAISYQWQANGSDLNGATASTYVLTSSNFGKTITVVARYSDGHGIAEQVVSSATSAVIWATQGTAGNDTLAANTISDHLIGDNGDDHYSVLAVSNSITEYANEGMDTVFAPLSWTLGANLESLTLLGNKKFSANGNNLDNTLTGNAAANVLDGGTGADTLIGEAGNDVYVVDNTNDTIQESGTDAGDSVRSWLDWTLGDNLENLTLLGTKSLNGTGNSLDNSLTGNGAANVLNGGNGNDTLNGLSGNDILTGSAGADTFAFTTPLNAVRNVDTITDFVSGVDKIELSSAIFKSIGFTGSPSTDAFFHAGSTAQDANDRILYNQSTGTLAYDADGTGTLAAVQFAVLSGVPVLLYSDIHVS